jgi:hypothetical protein
MFHELLEKSEPIHPRHFDVERYDVGCQLDDSLTSHIRVDRSTHYLDVRKLPELTRKQALNNY